MNGPRQAPNIIPKKPAQPCQSAAPSGPPHPSLQHQQPPRSAHDGLDLLSMDPLWPLGADVASGSVPEPIFFSPASVDLDRLLCYVDDFQPIPPQHPGVFQSTPYPPLPLMDNPSGQDAATTGTMLDHHLSTSDFTMLPFTIPQEGNPGPDHVSSAIIRTDSGGLLGQGRTIGLQASPFSVPTLFGTMLPWASDLGLDKGPQESLARPSLGSNLPEIGQQPAQPPAAQPCNKRKRVQDREQVAQTKRMREIRACVRCRLYRKKVSKSSNIQHSRSNLV